MKHSCLVVAQSLVDTKQGFEIHTAEQLQAFVDQWLHQQADIPKYLIPNGRKVSENDLYAQEKPFLVFPEKLASLLQVATYPLIIPRSAVVWLHGTKFRVSPRYAQQPAEVTFAADGSFIIALPSGLPIFRSGISAETSAVTAGMNALKHRLLLRRLTMIVNPQQIDFLNKSTTVWNLNHDQIYF